MRKSPDIKRWRVRGGPMASDDSAGRNGAFLIPCMASGILVNLSVIANDEADWDLGGIPWEHVSVSLPARCPTWDEMCHVKRIFWRDDETVIQLHVPSDRHVNLHRYCLHLWNPVGVEIPLPPSICVGPAGATPR